MANGSEETAPPSGKAEQTGSSARSAATAKERVILLECRLDQLRGQLDDARAEADNARTKLAEATAQQAEQARRQSVLHEELAQARAEIATLHRRLDLSEALRTEAEGHLLHAGPTGDAGELLRLRRDLLAERHRALVKDRALARLRGRVDELLSSRDLLLTRVAEWQQLVREDKPEAADLSSYLSELRSEILELERQGMAGESREVALRERLALAGVDPDEPVPEAEHKTPAARGHSESAVGRVGALRAGRPLEPIGDLRPAQRQAAVEPAARVAAVAVPVTGAGAKPPPHPAGEAANGSDPPPAEETPADADAPATRNGLETFVVALASADVRAVRSELLRRIGRTNNGDLLEAIRPALESAEAPVRAVAYEAINRVLERDPAALEPHLRKGLTDPDARVRRRVVLAAAGARGVPLRQLLAPLREDPDPQVHRVVREVLRHAPGAAEGAVAPPATEPRPLVGSEVIP